MHYSSLIDVKTPADKVKITRFYQCLEMCEYSCYHRKQLTGLYLYMCGSGRGSVSVKINVLYKLYNNSSSVLIRLRCTELPRRLHAYIISVPVSHYKYWMLPSIFG